MKGTLVAYKKYTLSTKLADFNFSEIKIPVDFRIGLLCNNCNEFSFFFFFSPVTLAIEFYFYITKHFLSDERNWHRNHNIQIKIFLTFSIIKTTCHFSIMRLLFHFCSTHNNIFFSNISVFINCLVA